MNYQHQSLSQKRRASNNNRSSSKTNSRGNSAHSLRKRKSPISLRIRDDSGFIGRNYLAQYNGGLYSGTYQQQKMIVDVIKQPIASQRQSSFRGGDQATSRRNSKVNTGAPPTYQANNRGGRSSSSAKKQLFTYDAGRERAGITSGRESQNQRDT